MQFSHKSVMNSYPLSAEIYQQEYQEFLRRLKAARIEAGFSQQEAAEKLGKSQSFVSRSENGQRRVDIVELKEFASLYAKSIGYFLSVDNNEIF